MKASMIIAVLFCGAGTFLFRWLPFAGRSFKPDARKWRLDEIQRLFHAIGPAAIASLFVVAIAPDVADSPTRAATIAAVATIVLLKRLLGGIAIPALAGAISYALFLLF